MSAQLFSAPDEEYLVHIKRCEKKLNTIYPLFADTIKRIFKNNLSPTAVKKYFSDMILFHDLGKLTTRWQETLGKKQKSPAHAPIGAAYLYKMFTGQNIPDDFKNALCFAVAIHHTDKGVLGDNIERPDVQAITDQIVDFAGNIIWHSEVQNLDAPYFPKDALPLNIQDLKAMARGFRLWAKGCELIIQHQRRVQAAFAHHILKLCDISAATERKEFKKEDEQDYYGGGLMVENIKDYVAKISARAKR